MTAINADCGPGLNPYIDAHATSRLRESDSNVRAEVQRAVQKAGLEGTVTPQIQYSVGPDGQLYAVGGTVTTSRVVDSDRISSLGVAPANNVPASLEDLKPASLTLSPSEFAEAFNDSDASAALTELRNADAAVRGHEAMHFRAAGGLAVGIPEYDYEQGPNGELYAVGGHVNVQTTATSDPEKAKRDANTFASASLAPGDASGPDVAAARSAYAQAADAYGTRAGAVRAEQPHQGINITA